MASLRLGKGSFGEVLVVRGHRSKLLYALKIVRDNESDAWNVPDHVVRREVEAMKRIDHVRLSNSSHPNVMINNIYQASYSVYVRIL